MSTLQDTLDEYLALRRALGYKLYKEGLVLQQFVQYAESEAADFITTRLALCWATQPVNAQPAYLARRLSIVRGFAKYRSASDSRTEVPPAGLLPYRVHRPTPYIYTDNEVMRLIEAALQLPSSVGLRRHTYATLFGLITVSGMRISELLHLDRDDVDLTQAILTVRCGKFGKARWIPLHSSTQQALQQYVIQRDRLCPNPQVPSFFVSERGVRLTGHIVRYTFVKLSRQIGLRGPTDTHGPRLHDFRHRFAVNTLLEWYRSGTDVNRHLLELATYLGHVHVTDTYWYLSATPELLQLAVKRLECE
ncbi:MAG: tyrosine-type recombinase/integrase [Gammaproteobacteria bacterium]|nr:tyrosine-type recombinase/integrase [Gammaproteobacteria bacterium]